MCHMRRVYMVFASFLEIMSRHKLMALYGIAWRTCKSYDPVGDIVLGGPHRNRLDNLRKRALEWS